MNGARGLHALAIVGLIDRGSCGGRSTRVNAVAAAGDRGCRPHSRRLERRAHPRGLRHAQASRHLEIVLEPEGVHVTAIPLDESVIRTLAPDSYRALHATLDSKRTTIAQRASMRGIREPRVWYVRFYGRAPDARFAPTDLTVTSGGRDYRPFDVDRRCHSGFGEQRLQPRDTQTGAAAVRGGRRRVAADRRHHGLRAQRRLGRPNVAF